MTYKLRPMYGIKESFFGPAAYREAEFQQSMKPQSAQSLAVGDSKEQSTIEGYEKTVYPQPNTKQELMGMAAVSQAQAFQTWIDGQKSSPEPPAPIVEYEVVTFEGDGTQEHPYVPVYVANKFYTKNGDVYTIISTENAPTNWGRADTFYQIKEV